MLLIINHKSLILYSKIKKYEKELRNLSVIVCPTNSYLSLFNKGKYKLASQDISQFNNLNRTGEINGRILKSLNVKYSLIAHSDRKTYNFETREIIRNKLEQCLKNNIIPLYCIGNDSNNIDMEIDIFFSCYKKDNKIIIFEPKENIGNNSINVEQISYNIEKIRNYILEKYNKRIKLIYGGGVSKNNIKKLEELNMLDGYIISTESININNVKHIYKTIN